MSTVVYPDVVGGNLGVSLINQIYKYEKYTSIYFVCF
jgi:hypothetical protein